jgi:hypothetical protein
LSPDGSGGVRKEGQGVSKLQLATVKMLIEWKTGRLPTGTSLSDEEKLQRGKEGKGPSLFRSNCKSRGRGADSPAVVKYISFGVGAAKSIANRSISQWDPNQQQSHS